MSERRKSSTTPENVPAPAAAAAPQESNAAGFNTSMLQKAQVRTIRVFESAVSTQTVDTAFITCGLYN
jgi:hypothetical protein